MKLIKHYFESIDGVEIYPIISMFVFISIFTFAIYWVFKSSKKHMDEMSRMPLDSDEL